MLMRHASHYLLSNIVSAALGLVSVVVFTRALSDHEYGVYVIGTSTAGILSAILFAWIRLSILRFQSEGGSVDIRKAALFGYGLAALVSPLLLVLAGALTNASFVRMAAAGIFLLGLGAFELTQEFLKAQQKTHSFMLRTTLRACAAFLMCLASAWLGFGGIGQLIAAGAAYFLAAFCMHGAVWSRPIAALAINDLKRFSYFGVPIALAGCVYSLHAALDRLIVAGVLGEAAAGQYGAAADLVRQIILVPSTGIASAALPLAVAAFARGGIAAARAHLERGAELLFATLLPACVGLALVSPNLAHVILGPDFRASAVLVMPILCFAWGFSALTQSYVHLSFHIAQRSVLLFTHGAATLIVNGVATVMLVSRFGLAGAAAALLVSEAFGVMIGLLLTRFACPLPLIPERLLRIALATGAMAVVLLLVRPHWHSTGLPSLAREIGLGVAVYACLAVVFDIAGIRGPVLRIVQAAMQLIATSRRDREHGVAPHP
jgi:O-antigen/teichoic acid export membrane protein